MPRWMRNASKGESALGAADKRQPFGERCVRRDQQSGARVVVAAEKFGRRVERDVRAQLERALEIGGEEGVVHHRDCARALGQRGDAADVRHAHHRVGRRLEVDHFRPLAQLRFHRGGVAEVGQQEADAEAAENLFQQPVGAAVDVVGDNDLVAALQQREAGRHRGQPACERERAHAAVEQAHFFLQRAAGGVVAAGVGVGRFAVVDEGGGLVDGAGDGGDAAAVHRRGVGQQGFDMQIVFQFVRLLFMRFAPLLAILFARGRAG